MQILTQQLTAYLMAEVEHQQPKICGIELLAAVGAGPTVSCLSATPTILHCYSLVLLERSWSLSS